MREYLFKINVSDIKVTVTIFDDCFQLVNRSNAPVITQMKSIHHHSLYEMFFVVNGRLSIMQEDGFEGFEHAAVTIPPLLNHYTIASTTSAYGIYFNIEKSASKPDGIYNSIKDGFAAGITSVTIGPEEEFYLSRLQKIFEGEDNKEKAEHILSLLFNCVFYKFVPEKDEKNELSEKREKYLSTIERYVNRNYNKKILLEDLASELYLCPKQVSRIIKREYGCSLSELVNGKRLASALMLLKYTDLKVGNIASSVGYDCENYFFTCFRNVYGITPEQYREENRMR